MLFSLKAVRDEIDNNPNTREFNDVCNPAMTSVYDPFLCFMQVTATTLNGPQYADDVQFGFNFRPRAGPGSMHDLPSPTEDTLRKLEFVRFPDEVVMKASRIYLQMAEFKGTRDEPDLLNELRAIAYDKYHFNRKSLILFTSVGQYLEQLEEIYPTLISMFLISFEVNYYKYICEKRVGGSCF